MTKAINKMLAVVLSFAMILTGFTFLGGAVAVNAEGELPTITNVIVDPAESGPTQPAADGVFAWFIEGTEEPDFSDAEVSGDNFSMQVKVGTGEWTGSTAAVSFELDANDNEGIVTATIPDNEEAVEKQWRFVYEGGFAEGVECPVITQAAAELPAGFEVTFDPGDEGTLADGEETAITGADGKLASLPTPTAVDEKYAFLGWFMFGPDGETVIDVDENTVFTQDAYVYANWIDATEEWNSEDFTYGEYTLNTDPSLAGSDAVFPGDDKTTYLLSGTKNVITGFSEYGLAKLSAGNTDLVLPDYDPEGNRVQGVGKYAFNANNNAAMKATGKKLVSVQFPEEPVYTDENVGDVNEKWGAKGYLTDGRLDEIGDYFIGYGAFGNNDLITVDIPDGTLFINTYAFQNNKLTKVTIPSSVALIGQGAFAGNSTHTSNAINEVVFPEKTDIRLSILQQAFFANNISSVKLPQDTLKVGKYAFMMNLGSGEAVTNGNANEKKGEIVTASMDCTTESVSSLVCCIDGESSDNSLRLNATIIPTVTFDAQGGDVEPYKMPIGENGKIEFLPYPIRDNYAFLGWFDAVENGNKIDYDTEFESSKTVYAHWSDDEDLVDAQEKIFDAWDAEGIADETLAAAKEAAKAGGDAAIVAAKEAQAAAQTAVNKARAAKEAADKAVAAMEEAGVAEDDPAYVAAKDMAASAEAALQDANDMLNEANAAVSTAEAAQANAAAAAEAAAREGTLDPSLPKVKAAKPKAAKKAVTAKWKKLSKKDQKKAAQIEIWVCPDKNFAAANTKEKVVGKKKASARVGGLSKKTTYYVKVRAIKNVNGVKYVGPWSKVKKIKTKK